MLILVFSLNKQKGKEITFKFGTDAFVYCGWLLSSAEEVCLFSHDRNRILFWLVCAVTSLLRKSSTKKVSKNFRSRSRCHHTINEIA